MSWTDDRVELLKKMWAEGKSASQIAKELGSVTRNAVIGKVHRLGLSSRGTDSGAASAAGKEGGKAAAAAPAATASSTAAAKPAPDSAAAAGQDGGAGAAPDVAAEAPVAAAGNTAPGAEQPSAAAAEPASAPDAEPAAEAPAGPATEAARAPTPSASVTIIPGRRPIVPAGQPLPPQPSANEISPETLASVREVEKTAKKLHLMELTERTCKWPIGDPATEEFWFCGLPSVAGKPYCEAHVSVAFQPMQSRRDRRR